MYIATIPTSAVLELQKDMKKNKIHYIIISASVIESLCELAYKVLIFEDQAKKEEV